jgi:hypothetical protein
MFLNPLRDRALQRRAFVAFLQLPGFAISTCAPPGGISPNSTA